MKRSNRVVGCVLSAALFVGSCGSNGSGAEVQTALLDETGGTITSANGDISLAFPADALNEPTTVTLTITEAVNGQGEFQIASRVVDITLDPEPDGALPIPALLSFPRLTETDETLRVARQIPLLGNVIESQGTVPTDLAFWLPLNQTLNDEDGHPAVQLARFSPYCVTQGAVPQTEPPADMLMPPPAPPGTRYVGAEVANNLVYDEGRSTAPLSRRHSANDTLFVRSQTVSGNRGPSDVVVVHIFEPEDSGDGDCPIPPDELIPPPPPDGMRYVGRAVVVNFVWQEGLSDEALVERPTLPTDATFIRSESIVVNSVLVCDYVIAFTYEPTKRSEGGADEEGGSASSSDELLRIELPPGMLEQPTDIFIDQISVPLGPPAPSLLDAYQVFILPPPPMPLQLLPMAFLDGFPPQTQLLAPFELQSAEGFVGLRPLPYVRLDASGPSGAYLPDPIQPLIPLAAAPTPPCGPPQSVLEEPDPPEVGCTYIGSHVVVDFVYNDALSTAPDRVDRPDDKTILTSETKVENGVVCDWIVAHVFEAPGSEDPCPIPAGFLDPPPDPAPGYCYKGRDVVVNFVLTGDSTADLNRPMETTDIHVLRSKTTVTDGFVCDVVVSHIFEMGDC